MRFIICAFSFLIVIHAQCQWSKSPAILNSTLHDIEAVSSDKIFATGTDSVGIYENGAIFRSLNGGENWDTVYQSIDSLASWMYRVHSPDPDIIYTTNVWPVTYQSIDEGETWNSFELPTLPNGGFDAIYFTSLDTGFVGNYYGEIFKTTNGGNSWELVYFESPFRPIYDISCPTSNICFARTSMPSKFVKSIDGGATWEILNSTPNTYINGGMHAMNEDTVIMVSSGALILRSVNSGDSWDTIPSPVNSDYADVFFIDNVGYAVGTNETIIKSTDYGANWIVENIDTSSYENINAVHMASISSVFACSDLGSIYRIGTVSSLNDLSSELENIMVFPNPFSDRIKVSFKQPVNGVIQLHDILGRLVKQVHLLYQESIEIDLRAVSSNIVTLSFWDLNGDLRKVEKLIQMK